MDSNKEQYYQEQMSKALQLIRQLKQEVSTLKEVPTSTLDEPIAIVGMGCRFPGGVKDLQSYWDFLLNRGNGIIDVPPSRWDIERYYDSEPNVGKMYNHKGGYIVDAENFDPAFFDISPREAMSYDPSFRLLLEVAYEALENAGIPLDQIKSTLSGVFVGQSINDYELRHLKAQDLSRIDNYSVTGSFECSGVGRLSYVLDLQGTNLCIETGCSASLVAVHLGAQSLRNRETDMAIVGGTNVITSPHNNIAVCQMHGMAKDGQCKTFDESANGFTRSDGCGIVILKRLSDAIRDKNHIWALVRGSAVNHVGRSNGPTAPSTSSQIKLMQQALKNASLTPEEIDFVEAHGTGTPLGDPIEIEAIQKVYGKGRTKDNPIIVGAVKTNFGHTEGAAGVAGLIKAVLAMQHQQIPPNLHFNNPSPHIAWDGTVKVPTELTAWKQEQGKTRLAGISSFGIGGTNAHIIIEEVSEEIKNTIKLNSSLVWKHNILPIAAKTTQALNGYAQKYIDFLKNNTQIDWTDVCAFGALHRTHFAQRLAIVASDKEQAIKQLEAYLQNEPESSLALNPDDEHKVVFVFAGQGSQWAGMGKVLYEQSDVFRQAIDDCEKAFSPYLDYSLKEELLREEADGFTKADVMQPALTAMGIGLAKLWQSVGVQPDAVVGHSMGEVASAYIAGALSLEDAGKIICSRSKLMKTLDGKGKMLLVELTIAQAEKAILEAGLVERVSVAVSNSPQVTVLSGDIEAIEAIKKKLENEGVECKEVKVNLPNHSPQMNVLQEPLKEKIKDIKPQQNTVPIYSTVTTQLIEGENLTPDYWADNLREPVMFGDTVQHLLEDGYTTFIEIAPHPVLFVPMQQIIQAGEFQAVPVISLLRNKDAVQEFTNSIGKLYAAGYPFDWKNIYPTATYVQLPTYPWQKKRYWLEAEDSEVNRAVSTISQDVPIEEHLEQTPIGKFFKQQLAKVAGYNVNELADNLKLAQMGVDSMMLTQIRKKIEKDYQVSFSTKDFWKYPTIKQFVQFVENLHGNVAEDNTTQVQDNQWFDKPLPRPDASVKLICFHHSGGSASMFYPWAKKLPDSVELLAVQLPGRAERMAEPCYVDIEKLIDDLLPALLPELDRPFAFFGHSMGGLLAFVIARRLRQINQPIPQHLFVSASAYSPSYKGVMHHTLSDEELGKTFPDVTLENFGGDVEYFNIVLTALRADLTVVGSFNYHKEKPLDCDITAFGADQDKIVLKQYLTGWENETSQHFELVERNGGHDYINHDTNFLTEYITEQLTPHMVQLQS